MGAGCTRLAQCKSSVILLYFSIFYRNIMEKKYNYFVIYHGVILGLFLIAITTFFYIQNSTYLLPGFNLFSIIFLLVLLLFSFFSLRIFVKKHIQHNYHFRTFFSICFLIMLVGTFLSKMYLFLLYNFDNKLMLEYVDYTYSMQKNLNPEYSVQDWANTVSGHFTFLKQIQSYVFTLIPCTLYAAIISLLIKLIRSV